MEIVFKMKTTNKRGFMASFGAAAFAVAAACASDGARWIWYPGDFETHHAEVVQARRLEWGGYTPVIWPQYRAYPIGGSARQLTSPSRRRSTCGWTDRDPSVSRGGGKAT